MMKYFASLILLLTMTAAHAGEKEILDSLKKNFPAIGKVDHINRTPYGGLYEIAVDGQIIYTDENGQYMIEGNVIEAKSRRNLTDERRRILYAINFDELPLDLAVKRVKGNGTRKVAVFADPQCGFCKKLEKELSRVTDVTIYRFLYPIFNGSDEIVRNMLCAKDPSKAWEDWMLSEVRPATANCTTQTAQVKSLGQKMHINGTPYIVFGNNVQAPGYLPFEQIERDLNLPKQDKVQAD